MSVIRPLYASPTGISITLASLASGSARESLAITNATAIDAMLDIAIKLQTGTPTGQKKINIFAYFSIDGALRFTDNATGLNAALTMRVPSNLVLIDIIETPDSGALTYRKPVASVAQGWGGVLPKAWGIVIENQTGVTFSATEGDHVKEFTYINPQNV